MQRPSEFRSSDIDLIAAIMAATGSTPSVYQEKSNNLAVCEMEFTHEIQEVVLSYAAGDFMVNAKRFAACRSWLYRKAKECMRWGGL